MEIYLHTNTGSYLCTWYHSGCQEYDNSCRNVSTFSKSGETVMSTRPENNWTKMKYTKLSASETERPIRNCKIRDYIFQVTANFTYLVTNLKSEEINKRVIAGNCSEWTLKPLQNQNNLQISLKWSSIELWSGLWLTYAWEFWTLRAADICTLKGLNTKQQGKMYVPIRKWKVWRMNNYQIDTILEGRDIVRFLKSRWING